MMDLLFLLFLKHVFIDLGLQAHALWGRSHEKYHYFGAGGHWHYLHHAIGTFIVFALLTNINTAVLASILDYIVHWHIDFTKHRVNRWLDCGRKDKIWWWTATTDQILHFLTYYLLVIYLVN